MKRCPYDPDQIREGFQYLKDNNEDLNIPALQAAIFVAAGGSMIGKMYAEQPADAYRDIRCGRGPYPRWQVERMQRTLIIAAEVAGLDPHHMPAMPHFHGCTVF